jgi:hypothetical protein
VDGTWCGCGRVCCRATMTTTFSSSSWTWGLGISLHTAQGELSRRGGGLLGGLPFSCLSPALSTPSPLFSPLSSSSLSTLAAPLNRSVETDQLIGFRCRVRQQQGVGWGIGSLRRGDVSVWGEFRGVVCRLVRRRAWLLGARLRWEVVGSWGG